MRGDHPRSDKFTKRLLELEEQLKRLFELGHSVDAAKQAQLAIAKCQETFSPLPFTSKDIDHCMQGFMLEAGLSIYEFALRETGATSISPDTFRTSVAIYYQKHGTIVLKTSAYWPTRCSVTHPHFNASSTEPGIGERSVLRLAMLTHRIICCESPSHFSKCDYQFDTIEFNSTSALSVPVFRHGLSAAENRHYFADSVVCSRIAARQTNKETTPALAGLCIESPTFFIDQEFARRWLKLPQTEALLKKIGAAAAHYLDERIKYRMVLYMSCLAQLSQGILRGREVHRVLLRAISNLAGGPDVTLHLCDMISDKRDERRTAARIVSAFGRRVRGFLLTERYSGGLVGKAIEQMKEQFIGPEQIKAEMRMAEKGGRISLESQGYRQILPGTSAEYVVPIVFYGRAVGAINLEWDDHERTKLFSSPENTRSEQAILLRSAKYYSLIVDYHDDHKNPLLQVDSEPFWNEIDQLELNRQALRYYVGIAYTAIRQRKQEEIQDYSFLQPIAQVVGYLNPFRNRLRVKVSIRRADWNKGSLVIVAEHGLTGTENRGDIAINDDGSILARVARCACPIFGEIDANHASLSCDELCERLMPDEVRNSLSLRSLPYRRVCDNTVYEVALPLVFGGVVMGTLDIEFFDPDRLDRSHLEDEDLPVRPQMLTALLDWARAISFLIAFEEDWQSRSPYWELADKERQAFDEFLGICLSVLAYVPIQEEHVQSIMSSYLNAIARVGDISFQRIENLDRQDRDLRFNKDRWIWTGTSFSGVAAVAKDEHARRIKGNAFFHNERAEDCQIDSHLLRLAGCLISANWGFADRANGKAIDFLAKIEMLASVFPGDELKEATSLSASDLLAATMLHLHGLLQKYLAPGGVESGSGSNHGWFIYCGDFDSKLDASVYRSGREGNRLAFIGSKEFRRMWEEISSEMPGHATFDRIMLAAQDRIGKSSYLSQLYSEKRHLIVEGRLTIADFSELLNETLASRTFCRSAGLARSLTLRIADRCTAEIVHDLARNPNRSSDYSEWFFGSNPYSLIGIPVVLHGRCVAVVQILRRRTSRDEMDFFSQKEFDSVCRLGKQIEGFLASNIEFIDLDPDGEVSGENPYLRSDINRLCDLLRDPEIKRIFIGDDDMQLSISALKMELESRFPGRKFEALNAIDHSRAKAASTIILDCRQVDMEPESSGLGETLEFIKDGQLREQWIILFRASAQTRLVVDKLIESDSSVETDLRDEAAPAERASREFLALLAKENAIHFKRHFKVAVSRRAGPKSLKPFVLKLKEQSNSLKAAMKQWLKSPKRMIFSDWLEVGWPQG